MTPATLAPRLDVARDLRGIGDALERLAAGGFQGRDLRPAGRKP